MKKIFVVVLSFVMMFSMISFVSANESTNETVLNIVNESNINFSSETLREKKVATKSSVLVGQKNALLLNSNTAIKNTDDLLSKYDILAKIDGSNKEKTIVKWSGKNKFNTIVSGEATVRVDINGYEEEDRINKNKEQVRNNLIVDVLNDGLAYIEANKENDQQVALLTVNQNWTNVSTGQVADYYAPYGITRNNYTFKKAYVENGVNDHFLTIGVQAQVNPGAQLCAGNSSYTCKYQVEEIRTSADDNDTNFVMVDHDPVNTGSSGTHSYSIGGGYGSDGFSLSGSYEFSINWSDLDLTDNSNSYGRWTWSIDGSLQSQVVTVDSGAIFIGPETDTYAYSEALVTSSFDSWNTSPVTGLAQKTQGISW